MGRGGGGWVGLGRGGGGGGGVGLGGQGGCEEKIEVFVKLKRKKLGERVGSGEGGQVWGTGWM